MDQIHAGQTATMRWPAFNQKTTAEIDEKFGLVSADIIWSSVLAPATIPLASS
jgi:hypothetical protein